MSDNLDFHHSAPSGIQYVPEDVDDGYIPNPAANIGTIDPADLVINQPKPGDPYYQSEELNPANGRPWRNGDLPQRGWTPARQRVFLEWIAEGNTVESACRIVNLTPQSAYAFRQRAAGAAFNLGWQAALLNARNVYADTLIERALDGQTVTITHADGRETIRHYYDNRLAMATLTRLDRQAEVLNNSGSAGQAARLIAQDFEAFLDMVEKNEGPARAGLFLAARTSLAVGADTGGTPDRMTDLDPILQLARADRYIRGGAALATETDVSDLDPANRAGWTGQQWLRAEAAGLIALFPPPAMDHGDDAMAVDADGMSQLPQPNPTDDDAPAAPRARVWLDEFDDWRTDFPPPEDFDGDEDGYYGDKDYSRSLTDAEFGVADAQRAAELAQRAEEDSRARDEHFGLAGDAADDADEADSGSADDDASDARPVAASESSGSSGEGDDRDGDDPVDEDQDDDMVPDEHNDPEMDALRDAFLAIGGGVGADRWVDGQPPAGGDYGAALDAMARFRNFRRQRRP